MNHSPLVTRALFHIGPAAITQPVIVTLAIMAFLALFAVTVTRRLSLIPSKGQTVLELFGSRDFPRERGHRSALAARRST
jgi:F-type H+-transporting ATPase subunit a